MDNKWERGEEGIIQVGMYTVNQVKGRCFCRDCHAALKGQVRITDRKATTSSKTCPRRTEKLASNARWKSSYVIHTPNHFQNPSLITVINIIYNQSNRRTRRYQATRGCVALV